MTRILLVAVSYILLTPAVQAAPPAAPRCPTELAKIAEIEVVPSPDGEEDACTISTPVRMKAVKVDDGRVALSGQPVLDCPFALSFARWTRDIAVPLAKGELSRELREFGTGTGFECRRRNRKKTGKLSEHSFGNAIDIVAFRFEAPKEQGGDAARFDVEPYEDMDAEEAGYLDSVRKAACGYFTTILGPGSNAAHADHLHFDLGRTFKDGKRRDNPYRICE